MKFSVAFLLTLALHAQPSGPGYDSIRAADLRADLTFLSSDAFEGRLSLDRGSEVAIQWIAAEFAKAGLKPLVGDSYLQPVPLIDFRPDRELTNLVLKHAGKQETYRGPDATASFPNDVTISGRVVFAGYGITAPELHYDDYAGIDVKGRVVLVFNHEPQEEDPHSIFNGLGNTRYANPRAKMNNAAQHGAVAILIAPDPNHPPNKVRQTNSVQTPGQRPAIRPTQAVADEGAIPVFNISAKVAETMLTATHQSPGALQTSIDKTLKPLSTPLEDTEVELHAATSMRRRGTSANVVGMLEGSDPSLKSETIIFSGHYDHDGPAPNGGIFHGADDNGSGTVGVVALARAYGRSTTKPKRSLVFIVFAAEERGLLGSYYYNAHPLRPLETTRAVINFDMIGRNETKSRQTDGLMAIAPDTSNELNVIGTGYSPDYRAAVVAANKNVGLNLSYKWDEDTVLSVLFRSDQYPFLMHNIPAMWWFTGFHPDYHQVTDTAEKINYAKMEKILKLAYLTGFEFANTAEPPKFVPTGATH
jgi:Peptidase family M28/PA domain